MTQDLRAVWDEQVEEQNKDAIAREFFRLTIWIVGNAKREVLDADLVRFFHRSAFGRIFPEAAGRVRSHEFPIDVEFGNFRGLPFNEALPAFEALSHDAELWVQGLDEVAIAERPTRGVQAACHHHARFIRIHPFVNGNGRTGRLCVNYFAVRYGLKLIPVERPLDRRYIEALRAYIRYEKAGPLVDLWSDDMLGEIATPDAG
jgi:Fic family protein